MGKAHGRATCAAQATAKDVLIMFSVLANCLLFAKKEKMPFGSIRIAAGHQGQVN